MIVSRTPPKRHIQKIQKIHKNRSRSPKPESLALIEARHLRPIFRLALSGSVFMCVIMCVCVRARLCVRERQRKRESSPQNSSRTFCKRERGAERESEKETERACVAHTVCVCSVF